MEALLEKIQPLIGAIIFAPLQWLKILGMKGLLLNGGHCGGGWCSPSTNGWICLGVFWLVVLIIVKMVGAWVMEIFE